jgi:hypothetical protein
MPKAQFVAQVESAKSMLMQKGNVIKLTITIPHTEAHWHAIAPFLGGYVTMEFAGMSKEDYTAKAQGQKDLQFEGAGGIAADEPEADR